MSKDTEIKSSEESNEKKCEARPVPPDCTEIKTIKSIKTRYWERPMFSSSTHLKITNHGIAINSVGSSSNLTVVHALSSNKSLCHAPFSKELSNTLPRLLQLEQQRCSLLMVRMSLDVIKSFKSTEAKINDLLMQLQEFIPKPFVVFSKHSTNTDASKLKNTLRHVSSILDKILKDIEKLSLQLHRILPIVTKSTCYDLIISRFESSNYSKQYVGSYCKLSQNIDMLTSMLLLIHVKTYNQDFSITNTLWDCRTIKDKTLDITGMLCNYFQEKTVFYPNKTHVNSASTCGYKLMYYFVLLPPPMQEQIVPCLANSSIDSISSCVCEVAKLRSCSVTSELCTVTLKALKACCSDVGVTEEMSREEMLCTNNNLNNHQMKTNTKSVSKLVKTFFKKLLENENKYIDNFLQELELTNNETLRGNTDALYKTPKQINSRQKQNSSQRHLRVVQWESSLGPAQKDFLYGTYMDVLWSNVKNAIHKCYVQSICIPSLKISRLNDLSLSRKEQDLLWQVQVMISKKDSSPQRFVDMLTTLSINISGFQNSQLFDLGLLRSMGLLLKDRFRYVRDNGITPSSATLDAFLKCQVCLQEQFKCLQKHKQLLTDPDGVGNGTNGSHTASLLHQLVTLHAFLRTFLLSKRQQFLLSATWEQFLVITTADVRIVFVSCQQFLSRLKEGLKASTVLSLEQNTLDEQLQFLEMFEKDSMKLMAKQVTSRSTAVWKEHMTQLKLWKRRGSKIQVYSPSTYIKVAMQMIFSPILDSIHVLTQEQKSTIFCKCISAFVKTWMEHILAEQIIFSRYGAQQLDFDFNHFVAWFESEEFGLTLEEVAEIYSLSVLGDMKNAIILLACQPDGRKSSGSGSGGGIGETNLLSNNFGSSSSVVSQVSIESFHGSQFDDIVKQIDIHNKERWLALRAKGGQSKRFLCMN